MIFEEKRYLSYLGFAIVAILLNLVIQGSVEYFLKNYFSEYAFISFSMFSKDIEFWFVTSLGIGTLFGFIFKFIVDKWIVFSDRLDEEETLKETTQQISLYFLFAIFTTIIFWGMESIFYILNEQLYLFGGAIGLAIGYTIKYFLDNKFVFK